MHLFESFALIDGQPEFLEAHLHRLNASVLQLHYQPQPNWLAQIRELLKQLPATTSQFGRIYVTAGDGSPAAPPSQARVFLALEPRTRALPQSYALAPMDCPLHGDEQPASGFLKSGHYSIRCQALQRARNQNADEALLIDPIHGALSASMANFFWKLDGHWSTAPIGKAVRNGVWREWWIQQINASESHLDPKDLPRLQSAALTSSWIGVMPVHRIGETALPESAPRIAAEPRRLTD
jgi:branched-subunit amino acid aminotransferase/4-amino-4-deoxychorismate lyase